MTFPTRRQSTPSTQTSKSSPTNTYTFGSAAQAGNLLVICLAGDKNTGTLSITDNVGTAGGANPWVVEVSVPGASVSTYVARKVAVGGETTVTATVSSGSGGQGCTGYGEEMVDDGTGAWMAVCKAVPAYVDTSRTDAPSGTSDTADYDGRALAVGTIDSQLSVTGSFSNGYSTVNTPVWPPDADGGNAGCWVATKNIAKDATTSTTFTTSGGDQLGIALVAFGRAESGPAAPAVDAGADASVAVGTEFTRTAIESGGAPTSRTWKIQSGPTGVGTTLATAPALSWTPSTPGTYVLRYSATNATGTGSDDVTVTVVDTGPGEGRWNQSVSPTAAGSPWYGGSASGGLTPVTDLTGMDRAQGVRIVGDGSVIAARWNVVPGAEYVASMQVKPAASGTVNVGIDYYDTAGWIGSSPRTVTLTAGTVARVHATGTAPAGAVNAALVVSGQVSGTEATAHLVEYGSTVGTYFDGSTPGATWDGTEWASSSRMPYGPRLVQTLRGNDLLTAGTSTTPSFTPDPGDLLVVKAIAGHTSMTVGAATGGGLPWVERAADATTNYTPYRVFTARAGATPSAMTVSVTFSGTGTTAPTLIVERWAAAKLAATPAVVEARGLPSAGPANELGTPLATLTTTEPVSAITWLAGDWQPVTTGTPAYRSGAAANSTRRTAQINVWSATQLAAAAGSHTVGLTDPDGQKWQLAALELLYDDGTSTLPDTAAERYGWGTPLASSDEFGYTGAPDPTKWSVYGAGGDVGGDECWDGHAGNGRRCTAQATVVDGHLRITGLADGDSGGISHRTDQQFGRWEVRARLAAAPGATGNPYHGVLIVWPRSNEWPVHGEYDFWEVDTGDTSATAFMHYPHPENVAVQQEVATRAGVDAAEWHHYALEWTPTGLTGYIDGDQWFTFSGGAGPNGRDAIQAMPAGHLTIQLDDFYPEGGLQEAYLDVDWARIYEAPVPGPGVYTGDDVASLTAGQTLTRTATELGSGITARTWKITAGPAGVGTTIGTSAVLSWTPSVAGDYVLEYTATNSAGSSADQVNVHVVAAADIAASATVSMGMSAGAAGTLVPTVQAAAAVQIELTVAADTDQHVLHHAAATAAGGLTVAAGATQTSRVSATAAAGLAVTTTVTPDYAVAAVSAGELTFTATAVPSRAAAAVLTGELTVSLSPSRGQPIAAAVAAELTVNAAPGLAGTAAVAGELTVTAGTPQQGVAADATADSALTVRVGDVLQDYPAAATAAAELAVTAAPFWDQRTAAAAVDAHLTVDTAGTRVVTPTALVDARLTFAAAAPLRSVMPTTLVRGVLSVDAIASSSAGGALNVKLFGRDRQNGGALVPLPHWSKLDVSRQINGAGSIAVEYPVFGRNFWLLARDVAHDSDLEVEIWLGGRQATRIVGYLQQADGDDVTEGAVWSFTGIDTSGRTDEIIIYPQAVVGVADLGDEIAVPESTVTTAQWTQLLSLGYTGRDQDTVPTVYAPRLVVNAVKAGTTIPVKADDLRELRFNAATPGAVMGLVIAQARARGAFTDITLDFNGEADSRGVPWPELVTAKWSPGTTATSILDRLVELGLVDWDITPDKVLRLFVQGTSGHLYTSGQSAVRLRRGVNLAQATHRASAREATTAVLAAGSGGLYSDTSNVSAAARRGRRVERYTTAGNIVDTDSLLNIAQRTASLGAHGPDERTFAIAMGTGHPRPGPGQTFDKADTLLLDTTGTGSWITARVAQWAVSVDPNGASGNVVVGDLISSKAAAILKRLTDTGDGSVVVGTSSPGEDTGIPRAPEGLVVGSAAFAGGSSGADEYASVTASWQAVVYNTDNTACTDLAGYRVEWRQDGTDDTKWVFAADAPAGSTQGSWTTACAIPILVRVRAYDRSGNTSTWTVLTAPHTTDDDTTPPGVPSTPICSNYLGTLRMSWNGRDVNGADMYEAYPDLEVVRVHMSQASSFSPDESNQVGLIYGAGSYTYTSLPNGGTLSYDTTYYFRLVAEDRRGNRSDPSGQDGATPGKLLSDDIFAGAVGEAQLADAVVTRAKIRDLAVGDAQIETLGVGKLTAGTLQASMIIGSGKIATGTSGARVEMDSAGLRLYNAAGTLNVNLQTANGYALVSGEYRTTNASTTRLVINPGGNSPDEMRFYPSSTAQYARMKSLTSGSTSYPNQAGIGVKGYSPRADQQSGEMNAFPNYARIAFSNEMGGGTISSSVSAEKHQVSMSGPRVSIGAQSSSGEAEDSKIRIGVLNNAGTQLVPASTLVVDNGGTGGIARLMSDSPNGNCGLMFIDSGPGLHREALISVVNANNGPLRLACAGIHNTSSIDGKTAVEDVPQDVVDTVRQVAARQYERVEEQRAHEHRLGPPAAKRFGLIAEELPRELRRDLGPHGLGVDLYDLIATTWAALRQEIFRADSLTERVAALEDGER